MHIHALLLITTCLAMPFSGFIIIWPCFPSSHSSLGTWTTAKRHCNTAAASSSAAAPRLIMARPGTLPVRPAQVAQLTLSPPPTTCWRMDCPSWRWACRSPSPRPSSPEAIRSGNMMTPLLMTAPAVGPPGSSSLVVVVTATRKGVTAAPGQQCRPLRIQILRRRRWTFPLAAPTMASPS